MCSSSAGLASQGPSCHLLKVTAGPFLSASRKRVDAAACRPSRRFGVDQTPPDLSWPAVTAPLSRGGRRFGGPLPQIPSNVRLLSTRLISANMDYAGPSLVGALPEGAIEPRRVNANAHKRLSGLYWLWGTFMGSHRSSGPSLSADCNLIIISPISLTFGLSCNS